MLLSFLLAPMSDLPVATVLPVLAQHLPPHQGVQVAQVRCDGGGDVLRPATTLCSWRQPTGLIALRSPPSSDGAAQGVVGR